MYFNIPNSEVSTVANSLIFYSMIFQIFGNLTIGYIYDLVGRKLTIFVSTLVGGLLVFLIPLCSPNVFPGLYIIRILYAAVFVVAINSTPLINDYIQKDSRGKANALQGFGVMFGELFNVFVIINLVKGFPLGVQCQIVGILIFFMSFVGFFIVKEPKIFDKKQQVVHASHHKDDPVPHLEDPQT